MYLGISLEGPGLDPDRWRDARALGAVDHAGRRLAEIAVAAERIGADFLVIGDSFAEPPVGGGGARLDAVLAAARVAPLTSSIALVAEATTTHTEPFHNAKNLATLDFVSHGRAGWKVSVSRTAYAAALFGRKPTDSDDRLHREAIEAVEVARRLWDSWEDDAVIRDRDTGRYIDRTRVHYVDFEGEFFSVRGPSITPRSPQGQPVVVVDATDPAALALAAAHGDLVVLDSHDAPSAARARERIRAGASTAGRDPDGIVFVGKVDAGSSPSRLATRLEEQWSEGGVEGFVVRAGTHPDGLHPDAGALIGALRDRGVLEHRGAATFRELLGLDRPRNRYATLA